jgi:hypothetical protein
MSDRATDEVHMAVYTVHEPPPKRYEDSAEPDRFAFVRDGFSFWACVLGPIWMLRHRMWLVLLGYVVLVVAIEVALHQLGASSNVSLTVGVLLALLIGFEAGTLRRFTLGRRKWTNLGIVVDDDLETAERRFFDAWTKHDILPARPSTSNSVPMSPAPPPRQPGAGPDVIGLFPQPGAQR